VDLIMDLIMDRFMDLLGEINPAVLRYESLHPRSGSARLPRRPLFEPGRLVDSVLTWGAMAACRPDGPTRIAGAIAAGPTATSTATATARM